MIKLCIIFITVSVILGVICWILLIVASIREIKSCNNGFCPICATKFKVRDLSYTLDGRGICTCEKCEHVCISSNSNRNI